MLNVAVLRNLGVSESNVKKVERDQWVKGEYWNDVNDEWVYDDYDEIEKYENWF